MKDKKYYLLAVFLLFLNLVYRFIDQSQMIKYFPLDYVNDGSSYMAQLFFMDVCGFHNFCPYWYNGFEAFLFTPPGWFFFAWVIYKLVGSITFATYISLVFSFVASFLIIYFLYGKLGLTKLQRVLMFFLLFGSAQAVGSFIRLVRVHELFAWVWFLLFAFIVLFYKNKKLDRRFGWVVIPYSLILLTYPSIAIFSTVFLFGLFLVKSFKEKIYLFLAGVLTGVLTSFWSWHFITRSTEGSILKLDQAEWLWLFRLDLLPTNIAIFLIPLMVLVLFYFYNKDKNDLLFFSPVLILALLFFFRLIGFIPILQEIFSDPYLMFFVFFAVYFFVKIDFSKFSFGKWIPLLLILVAVLSVIVNFVHTPKFTVPDDEASLQLLSLFSKFDGNFVISNPRNIPRTIYAKAVYSYAPIYHNLSTPSGWYPEVKDIAYIEAFRNIDEDDCKVWNSDLKFFNVTNMIGYKDTCDKFAECSFNFVERSGEFCLYAL